MHEMASDAGTGRSQWMTQRNSPAVDIQLALVQIQGLGTSQGLHAKRLVDLEGEGERDREILILVTRLFKQPKKDIRTSFWRRYAL